MSAVNKKTSNRNAIVGGAIAGAISGVATNLVVDALSAKEDISEENINGQNPSIVVGAIILDSNANDIVDTLILDVNNDGVLDAIVIDENEDGLLDAIVMDCDQDGVAEAIIIGGDDDLDTTEEDDNNLADIFGV